jgi:putative ABC transport system permease protein
MLFDLRQTFRSLLRTPGSSLLIVVILAVGVGANTGAFSALYALLLRPLPYPEPQRLVELYETTVDRQPRGVAMANLLDWRARSSAFESMAVYQPRSFGLTLGDRDAVTVVQTGMVMAGFFPAVGVLPALGRAFTETEDIAGTPLIVLTDRLWRRMFAADPGVIGRRVALNEEAFTIVGVMPPGFDYPMDTAQPQAFIPLSRKDYCCGRLGSQTAVARLMPGVNLERARAELESIAAALAREYPASNGRRSAGLRPLHQTMTGARREPLILLVGAASLLLLIACANVAGLLLARALARSHEFAIRASLGAGTTRLARHFFLESVVLATAGAVSGLLAADLVLRIVPRFIPTHEPLELNAAAFAFAMALAVVVALLLGAAPSALLLRSDLISWIHQRGRASGRGWFRHALVTTQIALSVVLLLSSAVLLRSFLRLLSTSPGFATAHALRFGIGLPEKRYDTERKLISFHRELQQKLADLPGVVSAGITMRFPLRGGVAGPGGTFQIAGSNLPIPQRPRAWVNCASPGYFEAMSIPLLDGRDFSWQDDRPGEHRVAIVNQTFARTYLRGRRPIGTLLDIRWITELNPDGSQWQVVGVTGDTRQANLDHEPIPEVFLSLSQVGADGAGYVIRARSDDPGLPQAVARVVAAQDPRIERVNVEPLQRVVERNLDGREAAMALVGGFGGLSLLLTAIGIYGIVSFRAAGRTREMAIRSALGATPPQLRSLVRNHAVRLAALGTAAGLAGFGCALPLINSQLYGIAALDPLSIAAVTAGVFVVALLASFAPSRRAGKSAPAALLRDA